MEVCILPFCAKLEYNRVVRVVLIASRHTVGVGHIGEKESLLGMDSEDLG